MKRRTFIKKTGTAGTLAIIIPAATFHGCLNPITGAGNISSDLFIDPPASARPYTWWHWMNGNITAEGITGDLEAMKEAGLGGFHLFEAGIGIPRGPVEYLSHEWHELISHTIKEADRLGLEFGMHNSPGWSSSGGPWVTPEMAMQHLSWTETCITGGKTIEIRLRKPYTNLDYYRDVYVLAFPSPNGEGMLLKQLSKLTSNRGEENVFKITGTDKGGIDLIPESEDTPAFLLFEFSNNVDIRNFTIESSLLRNAGSGGSSGSAEELFFAETSGDGINYTPLTDIGNGTWGTGGSASQAFRANTEATGVKILRISSTAPRKISYIGLSSSVQIPDILVKSNFTHAWSYFYEVVDRSSGFAVPDSHIINPDEIIDITRFMDSEGRLKWNSPPGDWTILRIGHTPVGTHNRSAPATGSGLEVDKYRSEALEHHFTSMFEKLLPLIKPLTSKAGAGLLIDSYEVGMQTWTNAMADEFLKRRGYELKNYLPAITGRYVGSNDVTERFLHDLRRTYADLISEKYYGHFSRLCRKNGITSYIEPICRGPMDEYQIATLPNIPMGEFWAGLHLFYPYNIEHRRSLRLAASATHVHGKKITGAEAFTAEPHAGRWQQYPYAMKAMGDYYFTEGVNRFVFHRFAHQPQHPSVLPGMTMGHWGTHFERTNTWWNQSFDWLKYISRCQYLLQQGLFVADILYHTGDHVPKYTEVAREDLSLFPPAGYDYDMINTESFLQKVTIRNGRITLPDGMSYKLFVLSQSRVMTLEMARMLQKLVGEGMILTGPRPEGMPGLVSPKNELEFKTIISNIWDGLDGIKVTRRDLGKGMVFHGLQLKDILAALEIGPDFEYTSRSGDARAHYIHRTAGGAEIYLITNPRRTPEQYVCSFRINGLKPEFWDSETGTVTACKIFEPVEGRIRMPVQLQPSGSVFVVFRSPADVSVVSVNRDGKMLTGTFPHPTPHMGKFPDVSHNFTISLWVKPEIEIGMGSRNLGSYKGRMRTDYYLFYPPEGEAAYGSNHAACSLTVGRNGVVVWERSSGDPVDVLIVETPVSGWSHIALAYNQGRPFLYINGMPAGEGEGSSKIVHPGIGDFIAHDGLTYYSYNGGMTVPVVYAEVLSENRILKISKERMPEPPAPVDAEISCKHGHEILIWRDGTYDLNYSDGKKQTLQISGTGILQDISGGWEVTFPSNTGAPSEIAMPVLVALNRHPEEGVRYFSGTATYRRKFDLPRHDPTGQNRLFLDLGRVEVIAEIIVNDNQVGILWKPPFRTDITDFLSAGTNSLEVRVTTLWPNRLIGDEQYPPEYEYGNRGSLTGGIRELPSWFMEGKPKPFGKRITFATWKHYHKDSPLIESGLLGPVLLRSAGKNLL